MEEEHLRRNVMAKSIAKGKFVVLAVGMCLLLTSMTFGYNSDHKVDYSSHRDMAIEDFCLVRSQRPVLLLDYSAVSRPSNGDDAVLRGMISGPSSESGIFSKDESSGEAEEKANKRKLGFKLEAGGATISGGSYGSSFAYGGGIYAYLSRKIGLEFLLERYSIPVNEDLGGLGPGILNTTPLLISSHFRFPLGSFTPYVLVGVGFYFYNFEPAEEIEHHEEQEEHQEKEVVDRFALHLGGGLDFRVSHKLDFMVELRYNLAKTWVQEPGAIHVDPAEQDIFNLYSLVFTAGIRYYF